jgi:hypothetical protein
MWDERKAIGVLMSVCAAELDREAFADRHMLLDSIARELESLADVLDIELGARKKPSRLSLRRAYARVLGLPLTRTIRAVLSAQLARLERTPQRPQLRAA